MRQFNNAKITLFDSANAQLKITVEGVFTRKTQIGTIQPLVYVTDQGNATLNPNIYLVFTYKQGGEERDPAVYMSYPQLFRLRETLETVKNLVADSSAFYTDPNGELGVKPEYTEALVLANIGKKAKWMSFKLVTISSVEEGVTRAIPAVSISFSDSNSGAAVLTVEEFLTIYSIINDLDLTSIQCQMSIAFLMAGGVPANATVPPYNGGSQWQAMPQNNYMAPSQNQYQVQPQYQNYAPQPQQRQQPRYNNFQSGYSARGNTQPVNYTRQVNTGSEDRRVQTGNMNAPQQSYSVPKQSFDTMPAREEKSSILSLQRVEETPIKEINYDDESAINSIFED